MTSSSPEAPPLDPAVFAARRAQHRRADRISGLLIAALLVAAFALAGSRIWTIATGPLPPGPGVSAPLFAAPTPDGVATGLQELRGKVVLVDFWATWCPPCVASMPTLQKMQDTYGARGFAVIGVNQEPGEEAKVTRFMTSRNLTFTTVMDRGAISREWGVYTFPTSFLLDAEGVIRATYRGPPSEGRLQKDIEALLPPEQAPKG